MLALLAMALIGLGALLWQEDRRRARRLTLVGSLDGGRSLAETPAAERRGQSPERLLGAGLSSLLVRADLGVSAPTFAVGLLAAALLAGVGVGWFLSAPLVVPLAVLAVPLGAIGWLRARAAARERAIQERLPEAVDVLARAVRAGQPMDSALREAGARIPGPLGAALRRLVEELSVGVPFERATRAMAARHPAITELRFLTATLILQRETGGNLARVLESLAATLRERIVLRRDVHAATAEGRASALVLALMPLFFAIGIALLRPAYVAPLLEDPAGRLILVAALILEGVGFFAMRWLARVEV